MVGVTSQGSEQEKSARSESSRVSNKTGTGTGAGCRNKIQGPGKTQHQGRVCRSECPLNTPV
ncbi:unnamed protein product [Staurois parvus]|uniref:Uncharacterized protein n=1 Tax=Staurois parvus TaxID=386267 RepID=A0ABN9GF20_9NEOB|nr:unnamed protein product [Staurois parvus]